jgi:hypothetical protein
MDTTPRDPHLPPPAVCDWLLEQTWPGVIPETRIDFQDGSPDGVAGSHLIGYQQARVAIGADEGGRIFLPDEALDFLRVDAVNRSKITVDPEMHLLQRILKECENTELSAIHASGVLHTAALLIGSKTFDLTDSDQEDR